MEFILGSQLSAKFRLHVYTYFLLCLLAAVSGDRTLDTLDSLYQKDSAKSHDFKTLWDVYILPHLELDLNRKYADKLALQGDDSSTYSDYPDQPNVGTVENEDRQKREHIDVAGLGNFDRMSSILDHARTTPLRTNFSFSRLQQLMRSQGRRRK